MNLTSTSLVHAFFHIQSTLLGHLMKTLITQNFEKMRYRFTVNVQCKMWWKQYMQIEILDN